MSADGPKPLRTYYPPIEPYRAGRLRVSGVHELYFEECGNPNGRPIVFLHGGPGLGTDPNHRRFFDPAVYRIVLFDQRGCGKSAPHASLVDNTTWHLVDDIEALRAHLGIDRWHVFGGSWGSTLALAYAETHPARASALILRGIFLLRPQEIAWFYQRGTDAIFPDAFERYVAPIPVEERGDLVSAFYRRLTSHDPDVRLEAAKAWSVWEGTTSTLLPNPRVVDAFAGDDFAIAFARIECHYFMHQAWLDPPRDLLGNAGKIRHIPGFIVQGRYDVVCPMESAWALHRAWPEAEFHVTADSGHAASEPGNLSALVDATDRFARLK
ncbi:MAG TPA: prolyl aminopeptidase [Polyangiaceae bacterium]|nr:prolyl aminopeptidase [Polyangiaceae bacterium]